MAIRNRWRFGGGLLASLTLCVAVHSQQAPSTPGLPPDQLPIQDLRAPVTPAPTPPPAAKRQTIEDLIAAIKAIRAKKAELDRQEQALAGELKKRVEEQGKQLAELGITRSAEPPPATLPITDPPMPPSPVTPPVTATEETQSK